MRSSVISQCGFYIHDILAPRRPCCVTFYWRIVINGRIMITQRVFHLKVQLLVFEHHELL